MLSALLSEDEGVESVVQRFVPVKAQSLITEVDPKPPDTVIHQLDNKKISRWGKGYRIEVESLRDVESRDTSLM